MTSRARGGSKGGWTVAAKTVSRSTRFQFYTAQWATGVRNALCTLYKEREERSWQSPPERQSQGRGNANSLIPSVHTAHKYWNTAQHLIKMLCRLMPWSHYHLTTYFTSQSSRKVSQNIYKWRVYLILAISISILFVARIAGGTSILLACFCLASTNLPYNTVWTKKKQRNTLKKKVLWKIQALFSELQTLHFSLRWK